MMYLLGWLIGLIIAAAISWIATCGIVYLITLCFDLVFSWAIATGIWLVLLLLKWIFSNVVKITKD